jgi:aryl-alcohol dehydrogenase-like predicted oxidoreductase
MAQESKAATSRRTFLEAGVLATAASAIGVSHRAPAQEAPAKSEMLPTRPLGKTGVRITMLDQGTVRGGLDRVIRFSFANGVRVYDTAKVYGSEPTFKAWFEQDSAIRKQVFMVDKDMPRAAEQIPAMVDQRLKALGSDYIDLFFLHSYGDYLPLDQAVRLVKSAEFGRAVDAVKKSGKVRFVGFSTHHRDRAALLQAAAEGGMIDAIMLQYRPWLDKDSPLNKAIDACWNKGIGLISMKQTAGMFFGDRPKVSILDEVAQRVPTLKERKLSPFQGLLHAIWTDERIACVCSAMRNTDQILENTDAARRFEPLKEAEILQLRDAALALGPTLCADCDGRCARAAGTRADLENLTRFLTYHEHHGDRAEARRRYAELTPEARDWSAADLDAARAACPARLNFARLLPEADRLLS